MRWRPSSGPVQPARGTVPHSSTTPGQDLQVNGLQVNDLQVKGLQVKGLQVKEPEHDQGQADDHGHQVPVAE